MEGYRYRVTIEVQEDIYFRLQEVLPKGIRRAVLAAVVEDIVNLLENAEPEVRQKFLGASASRLIDSTKVLPLVRG